MRQQETTNTEIALQDALDIAYYHAEGLQRLIDAAHDDTLTVLGWACTEHYEGMVQDKLNELNGALGNLKYPSRSDEEPQDEDDEPDADDVDEVLEDLDPDLT